VRRVTEPGRRVERKERHRNEENRKNGERQEKKSAAVLALCGTWQGQDAQCTGLSPISNISYRRTLQASRCRFLPPCAALGKDRMLSLRKRVPSLTFLTALCGTWRGPDAQFTRVSPISDINGEVSFLTAVSGTWQGQEAQFTRVGPISDISYRRSLRASR
jgi:hypothetical protein